MEGFGGKFYSEFFKECFDITIKYNTTKGEIIMCNLVDLSDKIFVHKDFVEVVNLKLPKGTTLLELFEQYVFDKKDEVVRFQLSIWKGVKLESTVLTFVELCVLLENKGNIVRLDGY